MSTTTRTVELSQLEQLNTALGAPGAPRVTVADLNLTELPPGLAPAVALDHVAFDGPPEYPYIHAVFEQQRVDLHTPALRELSRRLHLHHVWGV